VRSTYDPYEFVDVLDGVRRGRDWPLALAEQLLTGPTLWRYEGHTVGPTQGRAVAEVASYVTWSARRHIAPKTAAERLRRDEWFERVLQWPAAADDCSGQASDQESGDTAALDRKPPGASG
jgi:hypothetical protein